MIEKYVHSDNEDDEYDDDEYDADDDDDGYDDKYDDEYDADGCGSLYKGVSVNIYNGNNDNTT